MMPSSGDEEDRWHPLLHMTVMKHNGLPSQEGNSCTLFNCLCYKKIVIKATLWLLCFTSHLLKLLKAFCHRCSNDAAAMLSQWRSQPSSAPSHVATIIVSDGHHVAPPCELCNPLPIQPGVYHISRWSHRCKRSAGFHWDSRFVWDSAIKLLTICVSWP